MEFIGEKLKKARLAKKIKIDNVANELKISKEILNKIEDDNVNKEIYDVFLIGHLKSYSTYLDLNSKEIIEKFKIQNSFGNNEESNQIPKPILKNDYSGLNKIFSLTSIILISGIFYFLFIDKEKPNRDFALIPDLPENYESIIEKAELQISQNNKKKLIFDKNIIEQQRFVNSSSVIASSKLPDIGEDKLITLKILNSTWLQIRDKEDEIIISKLMNKNEEFTYELNLDYSITSGNAGNILVLINNNVVGRIGDVGEVIDSFIIDNNFSN